MVEKSPRIATYVEFWPYYLAQHSHPVNRLLHVLGTTGGILLLFLSPVASWKFALIAPLFGYGSAWLGHFLFERNRPVTSAYPLWSLQSDLKMTVLTWRGQMGMEIEKLRLGETDQPSVES